jgi:hypothetical protein
MEQLGFMNFIFWFYPYILFSLFCRVHGQIKEIFHFLIQQRKFKTKIQKKERKKETYKQEIKQYMNK